jgi:hypothetical protein
MNDYADVSIQNTVLVASRSCYPVKGSLAVSPISPAESKEARARTPHSLSSLPISQKLQDSSQSRADKRQESIKLKEI